MARNPIPLESARAVLPQEGPTRNPPLFGVDANTLRVVTIPLDNVRTNVEFRGISGNFLWALDATSLTVTLDLKLDHDQGNAFPVSKGFFLSGVKYNKFVVTNTAQTNGSITILYGIAANPPLNVVNPSSDLSTVSISKPSVIDTVADVSLAATATTQILAADTTRRFAIITNLAANTQTFRVGDTSAAAARGTPLAPGDTFIIEGTEAIHAHNPGAAAESVAVTTIKD